MRGVPLHRKLVVGGIVAAACMGVAAPAGAATTPVPLTFNHAVIDAPTIGAAQIVTPSTQPLTITADVDTTTGQFTVQPSDFSAPTYNFSSPVPGSLTLTLKSPASGQFDPTTGAVVMNADFLANISINGGSCVKDTGALQLSTSTTKPFPGQTFGPGATSIVTNNGAFGAGWSTLAPGTGSACSLVDPAVQGAGGIWISRGIAPTTPTPVVAPKLSLSVGKIKTVKAGKFTSVSVKVTDKGGADSKPVKVCLTAKKPVSPKSACKTISSFKAGASKTEKFSVKSTAHKAGSYKVTFAASGKGVTTVKKTVKVKFSK